MWRDTSAATLTIGLVASRSTRTGGGWGSAATAARRRQILEALLGKGQVSQAIGMAERQAHDLVQQPACLIQSIQLFAHGPGSWMAAKDADRS